MAVLQGSISLAGHSQVKRHESKTLSHPAGDTQVTQHHAQCHRAKLQPTKTRVTRLVSRSSRACPRKKHTLSTGPSDLNSQDTRARDVRANSISVTTTDRSNKDLVGRPGSEFMRCVTGFHVKTRTKMPHKGAIRSSTP